jgi:two-component system, OmpR family, response regulator
MRLLVVEDDVKLLKLLERGLREEGYSVDIAETGDDGLSRATDRDYDAVLLDVMLPGLDGFAVCAALRQRADRVPVLMLTARADVGDRIRGLDGGADDYLTKPFDFGELLARVRALIRRGPADHPPVQEIGELHIDPTARTVTRRGRQLDLTAREFDVLEVLARNVGCVVPRAQLLDEVWEANYDGSPNVVDVYVGYLRKKLERPSGPRLIRNVRGVGFVLEPG